MKIGILNIDSSQYGMPILHMEALQKSAEEIGPIGIRPVSKFALTYIQEGNPTKPFNVKNKSADAGPTAGLIAVNSLYARAPKLTEKEQEFPAEKRAEILATKQQVYELSYKKQIQEACERDMFKATDSRLKGIDLKIKDSRVEELLKLDKSIKVEVIENSKYKYKISWGEDYNPRVAYAKVDDKNMLSIYDVNDEPIKILGRSLEGSEKAIVDKGITADYDLLVVCPSYKDFDPGGKDKTPFPTQGLTEAVADHNRAVVLLNAKRLSKDENSPAESAKGGNWSKRIEQAVEIINANIASLDPLRRTDEAATVHHNAEFNNPFADDLKNSVPCLFLLPRVMDLTLVLKATQSDPSQEDLDEARTATLVLIEKPEEMNILRNVFRDEGFYWPAHARYADMIQPFRPEVMALMEADTKFAAEKIEEREAKAEAGSTASIFMSLNAPMAPAMNNVAREEESAEVKETVKIDEVTLVDFKLLTPAAEDRAAYSAVRP